MAETLALYEIRPPAALITLNRPERRNALSRGLITVLAEALDRAANDSAARCVILSGAGAVFCAGMDLAELAESLDRQKSSPVAANAGQEAAIWEDAARLAKLYDSLYRFPKPTIAAVNGAAVAGGAGLVTVCDLAVAVPEARLGYPEVRRGLVAAMVMPHLLRRVSERTARYLLLTGELIDAGEAHRTGLINEVVPTTQLLDRALALARAVAEGGPNALATTKSLLERFSQHALSLEEAAQASAAPRLTDECQAGLAAFFEKRPAPWAAQW
jgi:methylglutaconyl-CoA hydratase